MIFEVDVSDVDEEIQKNVDEFLFKIANELVNELKKEAPVHEGRLRQSIQIFGKDENKYYVGTNVNYAMDIQMGTEPFYPPIEPLRRWARLKLGSEKLGYAVQQKIGQEGISKNPYVDRAVENIKQRYR